MLNTPQIEETTFIILGKKSNQGRRLALHEIEAGCIGAEVPFSKETARGIFGVFQDQKYIQKYFKGIIPSNFIIAKDDAVQGLNLVWKVHKTARNIYYKKGIALKTGVYQIPNLIFKFSQNTLSVFAINDDDAKNINEKTTLFHAPFYNVYDSGSVCMGNVKLKTIKRIKSFEAATQFLENAFFNSVFTHSNHDDITSKYIKSIKDTSVFNNENLIPVNQTLKNII